MSTVKRECRVVMLPTERGIIATYKKTGNLAKPNFRVGIFESDVYQPQHLYILSDDEIKEGDWVLGGTNTIVQCMYPENVVDRDVKKIIATTDVLGFVDKDLSKSMGGKVERRLPQPSQGFIQKYIDAYNNGKPIEKVIVDYAEHELPGKPMGRKVCFLRVNPKDNTITISKVKDSWDREEVEALLAKLYYEDLHLVGGRFEEWVKENLK